MSLCSRCEHLQVSGSVLQPFCSSNQGKVSSLQCWHGQIDMEWNEENVPVLRWWVQGSILWTFFEARRCRIGYPFWGSHHLPRKLDWYTRVAYGCSVVNWFFLLAMHLKVEDEQAFWERLSWAEAGFHLFSNGHDISWYFSVLCNVGKGSKIKGPLVNPGLLWCYSSWESVPQQASPYTGHPLILPRLYTHMWAYSSHSSATTLCGKWQMWNYVINMNIVIGDLHTVVT